MRGEGLQKYLGMTALGTDLNGEMPQLDLKRIWSIILWQNEQRRWKEHMWRIQAEGNNSFSLSNVAPRHAVAALPPVGHELGLPAATPFGWALLGIRGLR